MKRLTFPLSDYDVRGSNPAGCEIEVMTVGRFNAQSLSLSFLHGLYILRILMRAARILSILCGCTSWSDLSCSPKPSCTSLMHLLALSPKTDFPRCFVRWCITVLRLKNLIMFFFVSEGKSVWWYWISSLSFYTIKFSHIQSTLVISNSKGLSEILRDIRSSTYQVCRIEEKIIWLITFNKLIGNWTFEVRDILKILWKRGEIAP